MPIYTGERQVGKQAKPKGRLSVLPGATILLEQNTKRLNGYNRCCTHLLCVEQDAIGIGRSGARTSVCHPGHLSTKSPPSGISLDITFLLKDKIWGPHIDAGRIGVAGHSQGGFTALWIGGAKVNADKYLAFQRVWRNNQMVPEYLRKELPLDAWASTQRERQPRQSGFSDGSW